MSQVFREEHNVFVKYADVVSHNILQSMLCHCVCINMPCKLQFPESTCQRKTTIGCIVLPDEDQHLLV